MTRGGVGVFLTRITRQLATWPQQAEHGTRWRDPEQAALATQGG